MTKKQKSYSYILGILLILLTIGLSMYLWAARKPAIPIAIPTSSKSCAVSDGPTCKVITGVITGTYPSCADINSYNYGKDADSLTPKLCDGPGSVKVDDTLVYTSSGFVPDPDFFSKDVSKIRIGDKVTAKYVVNDKGNAVLNCTTCGVFK